MDSSRPLSARRRPDDPRQGVGAASAGWSRTKSSSYRNPFSARPAWTLAPPEMHRLAAAVALAASETLLISLVFNLPTGLPEWANPVAYVKGLAQSVSLAALVFLLLAGHKHGRIVTAWRSAVAGENWRPAIFTNLALLSLLVAATLALSSVAAHSAQPPWHWFAAYCALLAATALSLCGVLAPYPFWRWLQSYAASELILALIGGALLVFVGKLSLEGWSALASVTLKGSYWILSLYEADVVLDLKQRILGVGAFQVLILKQCSGYEGTGLVAAFLGLYCWLMRRQLRFPHALLLIPAGVLTVWLLNLIRIAALVSIGAHLSRDLAVDGFHSQAGWISFVLVAVAGMSAANKLSFFSRSQPRPKRTLVARQAPVVFLAPFIALEAATILASAAAPYDQWLYPLRVVAVGLVLWWFRQWYRTLVSGASLGSAAIGVAVGVAWIATSSGSGATSSIGDWLNSLPTWFVVLWLCARGFGSIVVVPIAEELAFRGYLSRVLISSKFESVPVGQFQLPAFLVSTLVFGILHERWIAASFAGAVYALLMYRTKRLSDPIIAHMASNAAIIGWAVAAKQWSLL
jgi:exosortase E/protease (VPEID-CTERM system)